MAMKLRITRASEIESEPYRNEWGPWKLDPQTYALYVEPPSIGGRYDIYLESCTSSAEVCDWIFQIHGKEWADEPTMTGLVCALSDLLRPQITLCSWGQQMTLNAADVRALVDQWQCSQGR